VSFAATVLTQMELISPMLLHLDFELLMGKFELWRIATNFCFFGKFGLPFVFSMFFLVRYGKELEVKRFEGRAADLLWCLFITGAIQIAVAFLLFEMPFLSQSMLSVLVYLWAREYAEVVVSVFGLFSVQAIYFPWVLVAIRVLMGGSPIPDLVGIFAGHVYYFLEDVQGVRLKAPAFLSELLDSGTQQQAPNRNFMGGHAWGGGQRLGQ